jgi:hypothetical protein
MERDNFTGTGAVLQENLARIKALGILRYAQFIRIEGFHVSSAEIQLAELFSGAGSGSLGVELSEIPRRPELLIRFD